ncbi:U-box domain-containing protein 35-like [Oryza glaberrima]|uniref:U-box domain-containing protein 35-like n=1 Tax=Oryza glaberrima TaxID=4538 RepID=UPI00224C3B63|nr:U-box domain-containing protein 35-like [Oryza glaberrima]
MMAPPLTVGLALTDSKSSTYALQWALSRFRFTKDDDAPIFLLIHVLTKLLAVPTPMGNHIPIDKVRTDVADAYFKDVHHQAQQMLLLYKNMCHQNKVKAQVLLIKGNDVSQTVSTVVSDYQIKILIVGVTARTRKPFGNRTSSKICKNVPSFCTAYLVSKDGLSSLYSSALESDLASSSKSDDLSDEMSSSSVTSNNSSDQSPFDSPRLLGSNLPSENPKNSSPAHRNRSLTLYDYLNGSTSIYPDKDRRVNSSTGTESSKPSELKGSNVVLRQESLLQGMLSDNKDHISTELEKLRLELRLIQGKHKLVQDESDDASRQMAELAAKRMEEEAQLREIQSRLDKANDNVEKQKAHRYAAEQALNHVQDLVRGEVMQKNMLQVKASRDADKKLRLEKLFVLQGNSYSTFTWEEIDNATSSFADNLKIGSGANGTVYKGYLNHSAVAIKVLHSDDNSSNKHFRQELEVLGKIHHPHLVMLLGACVERGCLVYEYMENGSLEERLRCKSGTAALPWCDRLRIAWEVASALVFLHSSKPNPIIHRDLKPENILLDGNLVSKVGDVGLSTLVSSGSGGSSSTMYKKTALAGTLFYIDPEYQRSGQVSVKSDTYALGMVMLQLLTARAPIGLAEVVERAVEDGKLRDILDENAGWTWAMEEAQEMADLALRCLEMRGKDRPDLKTRVAVDLDRLKRRALPTQPPPEHFICPILKRVMQEPCIASDGYSYERHAIEMWVCDKDVSPVTNVRMPNKTLVPNRSLLTAITAWKSQGGRKPTNKFVTTSPNHL